MTPSLFLGLEHLSTAVLLLDGQGLVLYANPSAENLFEISLNHIAGQNLTQVFGPGSPLISAIEQILPGNTSFTEH